MKVVEFSKRIGLFLVVNYIMKEEEKNTEIIIYQCQSYLTSRATVEMYSIQAIDARSSCEIKYPAECLPRRRNENFMNFSINSKATVDCFDGVSYRLNGRNALSAYKGKVKGHLINI